MMATPQSKIWQLDIDAEDFSTGVEYVALVDDPAILRSWQAFNESHKVLYAITDAQRHMVQGPLMIPNLPIYRNDNTHGEHYVIYSAATIEKIRNKFMKMKNTGNVNLMHMPSATLSDCFMVESFITDSKRGIKAPEGFTNVPDGTWFGTYMIENNDVWSAIEDGTFKGFSVEGFFNYADGKTMDEDRITNLIEAVQSGTDGSMSHLGMNMVTKLEKLIGKEALTKLRAFFSSDDSANSGLTKDGIQLYAEGGFIQGSKVFVLDTTGSRTPCSDGKYELDNGISLEVTGGVIMNTEDTTENKTSTEMKKEEITAMLDEFKKEFTEQFSKINEALTSVNTTVGEVSEKFKAVDEALKNTETAVAESKTEFAAFKKSVAEISEGNKEIKAVFEKLEATPATAAAEKVDVPLKADGSTEYAKTLGKIAFKKN